MDNPTFKSDIVTQYESQVAIINDIYNGTETANNYLIQYENETDKGFVDRKKLSRLSNYVRDYVETIGSMIFRNEIDKSSITNNELLGYVDKIDYVLNIDTFAKEMTKNLAKDGITYLLVEKDGITDGMTRMEASSIRPYFLNIKRQSVLNYKQDTRGNFTQFTYSEIINVDVGYGTKEVNQTRCYIMKDGKCQVEIWQDSQLVDVIVSGLNFIPVFQVGHEYSPKCYDLAIINKNHFNLKSEQRFYVRRCSNPQMVSYLLDGISGDIELGADKILNFNAPKGEAGFEIIEMSGNSNSVIQNLLDNDEIDMKKYITALISDDSTRTATEVKMLSSNSEAVLSHYASLIEEALNYGIQVIGIYQNINLENNVVYVNRSFIDEKMKPDQIAQLKDLYINNIISWDKMVEALVDGKVLYFEDKSDIDKMKESIVLNGIN